MLESDFWRNHLKLRLDPMGDFVRVENTAEPGTPDVNYAIGRAGGWIELKVIRSGSMVFKPFQLPWMAKRTRATGQRSVWVAAWDEADESTIFIPALSVLYAARTTGPSDFLANGRRIRMGAILKPYYRNPSDDMIRDLLTKE